MVQLDRGEGKDERGWIMGSRIRPKDPKWCSCAKLLMYRGRKEDSMKKTVMFLVIVRRY